jgi:hypothetical protein
VTPEQIEREWQDILAEHPMLGDIRDWMLPPFVESDRRHNTRIPDNEVTP